MLRRRRRVRVVGASMEPTLRAGDVVFVQTDVRPSEISEGDIVVADHPVQRQVTLVKRVRSRTDGGGFFVHSDNVAASDAADSRTFGPIEPASVVGRVTSRLSR